MTDEILEITSKLNGLSDLCSCAAFAAGEAVGLIDYKKYRRQVDIISGAVQVLQQLEEELRQLSDRADRLALDNGMLSE